MVEQGKLRAYGISIGPVEDGLRQIRQGYGSSIQVIYNLLEREPEKELLPAARKANIAIIPRVPLAYGFLTGKYNRDTQFDRPTTARGSLAEQKEDWVSKADRLKPLAEELGISMSQLALQFILAHDAVSVVIPGARNEKQARSNAAAGKLPPLEEKTLEKIRRIVQ